MKSTIKRRLNILIISVIGIFLSTWLEFFLHSRQYLAGQHTNKVLLFLLINLHIVIIIVFLYLIIRQSIKLFVELHRKTPGSIFKRNLLFVFAIFSVIPTFLVFFIAGKLITASMDERYNQAYTYLTLQEKEPDNSLEKNLKNLKQLKSSRNPVYWSYLFTFILVTLLILFLSIWCAFYLAKGISKPIQQLLEAIEKIRKGNWNVQVEYKPTNELKNLAIGFNEMTKVLQQAHNQLQQKNKEMLMIFENLKESVFFVNKFGKILTYNTASKELVEKYLKLTRFKNKKINFFGPEITKIFFKTVREFNKNNKKHFTKEITFTFESEPKTLLIHLTYINNYFTKTNFQSEDGLLVLIEDLTNIVKINKMKTWQEAAKQMAHEIKNPLTPIQIATQRLQRKYRKNLNDNEKVFLESTNTILNHVKIIRDLVTHFSEFAQLPTNKIESFDFNKIIKEVVCLYQVSYPKIEFVYKLEKFIPLIKVDKKKIKRIIINLLDNSVRVLKKEKIIPAYFNGKKENKKQITIKTNFKTGRNQIELIISDNGPGIPKQVKDKLFLPYVSTEKKNMGLGLAIVNKTITQIGGNIKLLPTNQGATFQILLPV